MTGVLCAAVGYFSLVLLPREQRATIDQWRRDREARAHDQVLAIRMWVDRRLGAAEAVAALPSVARLCRRASPPARAPSDENEAISALTALVSPRGVVRGIVVDSSLRVVARDAEPGLVVSTQIEAARAALATGKASADFHRSGAGSVWVTFVQPVRDRVGSAIGAVIVAEDPSRWLYPYLAQRVGATRTTESYLVRREGDSAAYLSPLRHDLAPPLTLRHLLSDAHEAALAAREGWFGVLRDYRGTAVLAAVRQIPPGSWALVSTIDEDEALAGLRSRMRRDGFVGAVLCVLVLVSALVLWRSERAEQRADLARRQARLDERVKVVMESLNDIVYEWDARQQVDWYGNIDALMGYESGEFPRTLAGWQASLHPDDHERVQAAVERHLDDGAPYDIEYRIRRKDGSYAWWAAHGTALRTASGRPHRWVGAITDVSRRRRAEEELRQSEERLRQAVQASQIGIFDHDQRSNSLYWSPELRSVFGWTADEDVSLQEFLERVHPGDRERIAAAVRRAHDPGGDGTYEVELRIVRRDGGVRWVSARSQTFFEGEGGARRPRRTVGAFVELTQRKRVEEELRESTRVLLESQRVARLGSFRTDLVSGTWRSSEILDEIFGIADSAFRKDVAGWLSVVHPDERDAMAAYLSDEVLGQRRTFDREYRIVRVNDGEERWVHGRGELVCDEDGVQIEMIGTIQDITERKRAEAEKAQVEAMLLQSQKIEAIGRLAGGVAHDFNNLLSVIRGHGERLLAELGQRHPQRGRVEQVVWASDRAGSLTRQLLAFSRRQVLEPRVLRLDAVVADARLMLERVIGEDVELAVAVPDSLGSVRADPGQLVQVLLNLAVNARDAMPRGGQLTLELADADLDDAYAGGHPPLPAGRYVMMAVSDSGHGMDAETQRRAFEPFFTTKPEGEGTGLGLSTVYGIVKQSGGFIWIYSEPGVGTTFKVFLPRVDVDVPVVSQPPAVPQAEPVRRPASGGRVLLVEDDDGVRELMTDILETAGYAVMAAGRPVHALELARSMAEIDVLVTDVIMPGMSGRELATRLAEQRPGLRVVFVSGYAGEALARHGGIERGERFLQKPFSERGLLDIVAAALGDEAPGIDV